MLTRWLCGAAAWSVDCTESRRRAPIRPVCDTESLEPRRLLSGATGQLFVCQYYANSIGEYSTSGTVVNAALVSALDGPSSIAISGSDLFVANQNSGTIGEYTTSGATVNAALISVPDPLYLSVHGSDLFVSSGGTGRLNSGFIAEYTTSGATVNASLISGLFYPGAVAVSGSNLFEANFGSGTIGEYSLSGATINASLVSGLTKPNGLVLSGSDLFVTNAGTDGVLSGTIGEYTTSGATVNASLVAGLGYPLALTIYGQDLLVPNLGTSGANDGSVGEYTTAGATVNASLESGPDANGVAFEPSTIQSPGSPDPTFNAGNPVTLGFAAQASTITPAGQTLLAGLEPSSVAGNSQAVLEQLNADGSIDSSFGSAGIVTDAATNDEAFYGVITESSGTIVAAGISNGDLLLAGYNSDGSVDSSFGAGGRVTLPVAGANNATAYGITTDASGNIVVVGSAGGQFLADRFTASGIQDPAFNNGSPLLFGTASDGEVLGKVAVQSNGGIVADGASAGSVVVVRLASAGGLDPTFGGGGVVTLSQLAAPDLLPGQPDHTEGLTIDSEGRILVANTSSGGDFATARLTPAGSLDTTFGSGGVVTTDLGGSDDADFVAVQPDGSQIIVAGTSTSGGVVQEAITAYTPAGVLDMSFGNFGTELLSTGLSAAPALLHLPARPVGPQAEGSGTVLELVFGNLAGGKIVVGAGRQSPGAGSGVVQRFFAAAPTATPLPAGTLGASVSAALVVGGAKAKASAVVTLSNPSSQTISGPATVTLYVSLGQSLGGATHLLTVRPKLKLKPHGHTALRLKLSSFPSLPMGSYYLIASVDAPDGSSTGAAGPSVTISPAFVKVIASNVVPAAAIAPGKKTTLALTLQNQGNVPAMGTPTVTIAASAEPSGTGGTTLATAPLKVKLKPGASGHYKVKFTAPASLPAGRYYLALNLNVAALGDDAAADGLAVSESMLTVT